MSTSKKTKETKETETSVSVEKKTTKKTKKASEPEDSETNKKEKDNEKEKEKDKKKKETQTKKSSKFISKTTYYSLPIAHTSTSGDEKPIDTVIPDSGPKKTQNLPNVVVCLKCQLSDLQETTTDETIIENNPYQYKAWVPSDIKTYNNDYQMGSLLMEPLKTEKDTNIDQYAYLDAKLLTMCSGQNNVGMGLGMSMNHDLDDHTFSKDLKNEKYEKYDKCDSIAKSEKNEIYKSHPTNTNTNSEKMEKILAKETQEKIFQQKVLLYHGMVQNGKRSACFWCTYDYDTPICSIPYYNVQGNLDCYGSFCRPECAVAYLYSEKLDDSVRAERDQLINYYYGKSSGYEKRIKPAPDPHYLLDKFYGNLSIQEYRKLLKSEHLLATLDKPLTRVFPELHEITDDFLIKIYGGDITLNRGYRVKRASEQIKGPSKMEIIRDQFKMALASF